MSCDISWLSIKFQLFFFYICFGPQVPNLLNRLKSLKVYSEAQIVQDLASESTLKPTPVSFDTSPLFFEHFIALWYKKILQVSLVITLSPHGISHFSEVFVHFNGLDKPRLRCQIFPLLWQCCCFHALSADRTIYAYTDIYICIYSCIFIHIFKTTCLHLHLNYSPISFSLVYSIFIFVISSLESNMLISHYH